MIIREHALEEYWLIRRLSLLTELDTLAHEAYHNDDYSMDDNDRKITMLKKHYADVLNPIDVEKTLKSIYPPRLYSPEVSKRKQK